jgi:hypothetical protein
MCSWLVLSCHYSATANSKESTQFNSSVPKIISWQAGVSKLDSSLNGLNWALPYNYFAQTTQKAQAFYCWEGVFTALLHSNGRNSIVACVFVAAGMCLPSRCLAVNVYSYFTIPAFGVMSQYMWYLAQSAVQVRKSEITNFVFVKVHRSLRYYSEILWSANFNV